MNHTVVSPCPQHPGPRMLSVDDLHSCHLLTRMQVVKRRSEPPLCTEDLWLATRAVSVLVGDGMWT
jgi:hypothetical protein